ncbi:hypothetical protein VHUM_00878 [Vanrija humicola]|uniref:CBF1-interacting co-repressor CIR N-terminal domain-containing protein n=1 Tax=Vanrija humicola TaxID=5417 RepID=A0A7D8YZ88_VANHU|nr:hypothetical protein VHUM_00878 [Vanrija humicola]
MGGGDLNMKKSWHPALLVNQERVWKAQKEANEEKKALQQLRKEREEERQLAELQRMQEAATGKKRVEKLDWMYAAPSAEDGAMGGRMSERELEDYLLGKKRVDEVLAAGDKNVGASHRDFVAVQNANTARDTAAKIREDPVLAMKKAEQAAIAALMNRPDIRRQLKAAKKEREGGDDKEERRARRRAEKEERRKERHERRERRGDYDRSPRSEYSDERRDRGRDYDDRRGRDYDDRRRDDRGYRRDDRDDRGYDRRDDRDRRGDRDRRDDRERERDHDRRPRSRSPKRERDDSRDRRHESSRSDERRSNGHSDRRPSPKREREREHDVRDSRDYRNGSGPSNGHANGHSNGSHAPHDRYDRPARRASPERKPYVKAEPAAPAQDDRAARLAAMTANATSLNAERTEKLARRAVEEKAEEARDEKARSRYHRDEAAGLFMKHQEQMGGQIGLAESLQRRGGKGLLRDI